MNKLKLIAGPCSMESEQLLRECAGEIKRVAQQLQIEAVFKASFDKANRTSLTGFRGPGMKEGLSLLEKIKTDFDLPVITDIHEANQAAAVAKVADILQIPAFLCRQTDLLVAAAKTGKPVNVKKAQFLAPWDMKNVVTKLKDSGCKQIMLCERGTSFGYNRLVVDFAGLIELKKIGCPVVFDATHSVQQPGGAGNATSGNREYVPALSRAAAAIGIDALFLEVHPNPDKALSDGPNMLALDQLQPVLESVLAIDKLVKGYA